MECFERPIKFPDQLKCTCGNSVQDTCVSCDEATEDVISECETFKVQERVPVPPKVAATSDDANKSPIQPPQNKFSPPKINIQVPPPVISNGAMESNHTKHLQDCKEVTQVGMWGKQKASPHNHWDFRLEKNHKLVKISIDHGDLIFSLKFTTQDGRGCLHESKKAGGWNGGCQVSEVTFDYDEELTGISGTVGVSRGKYAGYTVISSLSFITNKRTHGPFGQARGTHFAVPWNKGSFAGFYGLCGYYIDGIGVYLRATM